MLTRPCDLFINIPFVVTGYDHLTGVLSPDTPSGAKDAYLDSLFAEIEGLSDDLSSAHIRSITLGCGSSSTLELPMLRTLRRRLCELVDLSSVDDFSVTLDPGLLSSSANSELHEMGVTRYVFRYLSSDARECDRLGIPGSEAEMAKTRIVLEYDRRPIVDIVAGVGILGQTERSLLHTLRESQLGGVDHYELLPMRRGCDAAASDEEASALFEVASDWLERQGYERYTATCFALDGKRRPLEEHRYSIDDQISFGPGTVSCGDGLLWSDIIDIDAYIAAKGDPDALTASVAEIDERASEARRRFDTLYHLGAIPACPDFDALVDEGLLVRTGKDKDGSAGSVRLSSAGALRYLEVFERMA